MTAIVQAECTDLWNAYFDQHGVDFIMTPSLWGDAATYNDVVSGSGSLSVKQADNAYKVQTSEGFYSKRAFYSFTKLWAVPKLLIPLGLDALGRPVSCTAWGKAVPRQHLYDDTFAKTWDIAFMYKVRKAVEAIYVAKPELRRKEPGLNEDVFGGATSAKL